MGGAVGWWGSVGVWGSERRWPMKCSSCGREWPAEFKVCPLCVVSLGGEMGEGASEAKAQVGGLAAGAGGVVVGGSVQGCVIITRDGSEVRGEEGGG